MVEISLEYSVTTNLITTVKSFVLKLISSKLVSFVEFLLNLVVEYK